MIKRILDFMAHKYDSKSILWLYCIVKMNAQDRFDKSDSVNQIVIITHYYVTMQLCCSNLRIVVEFKQLLSSIFPININKQTKKQYPIVVLAS